MRSSWWTLLSFRIQHYSCSRLLVSNFYNCMISLRILLFMYMFFWKYEMNRPSWFWLFLLYLWRNSLFKWFVDGASNFRSGWSVNSWICCVTSMYIYEGNGVKNWLRSFGSGWLVIVSQMSAYFYFYNNFFLSYFSHSSSLLYRVIMG